MTIIDTVMGTVNTAIGAVSTVAQSLVEKNRINAKLNRLRLVMKTESELMNRAYIALGKRYYENSKTGEPIGAEEQKKLFEVIESSKKKIAKARECYRKIVDSQNDVFYGTPENASEYEKSDVVDITVACSNENEYQSSPFKEAGADSAVTADAVPETVEEEKSEPKNTEQQDDETTDSELF